MGVNRLTSLSAGIVISKLLSNNKDLHGKVTAIFPVAADKAELPYIVYKRTKGEYTPVKTGTGADSSLVEILCCAASYGDAVNLAEIVRRILDGAWYRDSLIEMRCCRYESSDDFWEDDAYVVRMIFKISIA